MKFWQNGIVCYIRIFDQACYFDSVLELDEVGQNWIDKFGSQVTKLSWEARKTIILILIKRVNFLIKPDTLCTEFQNFQIILSNIMSFHVVVHSSDDSVWSLAELDTEQ